MRFNSDDLKTGDLIVVPYSNYLHPAIFAGWGVRNNPQFYLLNDWRLQRYYDAIQQGKKFTIYKDYIIRDKYKSIVKISEDVLGTSEHILYVKFKQFLQEKGKI